jgi:hypothetical protein
MMEKIAWLKVVTQNRQTIFKLVREAFFGRRARPINPNIQKACEEVAAPNVHGEVSV